MARDRSKSIVHSIASKAVSHASKDWKPDVEMGDTKQVRNPLLSADTLSTRGNAGHRKQRSYSQSSIRTPGSFSERLNDTILYPFTKLEESELTQAYLHTLSYNSVLDYKHTTDINDFHDDAFHCFKSDCDRNIEYFETLLKETNEISEDLCSLRLHYDHVMKDTEAFSRQSRDLLKKQEEMGKRAAEIDYIMKVFEPLESISKALNSSGTNLIRSGRCRALLVQLQENLEFLEAHQYYKDAEVYLMRYRQCITRALTLVRNYCIDFLRSKMGEVNVKLTKGGVDSITLDIMMYSEFTNELERQTENTRFPNLIQAIASQCPNHREYEGLLSDVLDQYFKLRSLLTAFYIQQQLPSDTFVSVSASTQVESINIVKFCQKSISQYKRILEKEFSVFSKYFACENFDDSTTQFMNDKLYTFLKQILEPFYDEMRNKILKESSITELSHLTNLLTTFCESEDDSRSTMSTPENKLEYGELLEPALNDAQARLIFRIQNYIDNKLLKYKPTPEDLQLGSRRKSTGRDSILGEFEGNMFPDLYVPVGKALTILSNLYELVNSFVFDDIAHHVIHSCIHMLKYGAMDLAKSHLGSTDAKLFYLKNLIMLKDHLNSFDIQFVRTETSLDFLSGIQELIHIIRSGRLSITFNSEGGLLELVKKSAPKVINDMIDAQKEIEIELSDSFNEYITECANITCEPILNDNSASLKEKATMLTDNILMKFPQIKKQVSSQIGEDEFIGYALSVLSKLIYSTYESYYRNVQQKLLEADKADQLNDVMEPETFYNFLSETIAGLDDIPEVVAVEMNENIFDRANDLFDESPPAKSDK